MEPTFKTEAEGALSDLHVAIRALLDALPAAPLSTPSDLARVLDLGFRQAWQVHRFASAPVPLAEAAHLPLRGGFRSVLNAARRAGVGEAVIAGADEAWTRLESVVRAHAPDRAAFDTMTANVAGAAASSLDRQHKRTMYRAARHLFGLDTTVRMTTMIVMRGASRDLVDIVALHGSIGITRYHPGVPFYSITGTSDGTTEAPDDPAAARGVRSEPLEPPTDEGVMVLREFSTQPLPPLRARPLAPGTARFEFGGADVGTRSAADLVRGEVIRNVPGPWTDDEPMLGNEATLRAPCETLQLDVLYDREHFPSVSAGATVYVDRCRHSPALGGPFTDADRLPVQETVAELRTRNEVCASADYHRYGDLIAHATGAVGIDPARLSGYRCRIEYPIVQTTVRLVVRMGRDPRRG